MLHDEDEVWHTLSRRPAPNFLSACRSCRGRGHYPVQAHAPLSAYFAKRPYLTEGAAHAPRPLTAHEESEVVMAIVTTGQEEDGQYLVSCEYCGGDGRAPLWRATLAAPRAFWTALLFARRILSYRPPGMGRVEHLRMALRCTVRSVL
jgi:hypothetical protein